MKEEGSKQKERKERKQRVDGVTEILSHVFYTSERERQEAILSFIHANLTISEIELLVRPLRMDYSRTTIEEMKNKNSQVDRRGVF